MNEILDVGYKFFQMAPGPAAIIIVGYMWFKKSNKPKDDFFVKREDCHRHVDSLKEDIKDSFDTIRSEIREIRTLIIGHIDSRRD